MKKVRIERIFHRDRWRYAMFSAYVPEVLQSIRNIPGIQYSGTHKCWYTDETEECMKKIINALEGKAEIDASFLTLNPGNKPEDTSHVDQKIPSDVGLRNNSIDLEKAQASLTIIPPGDSISLYEQPTLRELSHEDERKKDPVEFRIEEDHLVIRFTGRYDKGWIEELNTYGKLRYSSKMKEFYLPWSKMTVDSLSDYFGAMGVEVRIIKKAVPSETAEIRKHFSDDLKSRELTSEGQEAVEKLRQFLEENRYSIRTLETYISALEIFFRYFSMKHPGQINHNDISYFINEFIIRNGFSASYQNQMISAIKLYYEISGSKNIIPALLERPRRSRALPKVFSKEEVTRILNSAGNIKHKMLLWIIYSCGLRRSEVTNILLTDIDRIRNIIHIREGKGGVDRIVPVPERVWAKYDEYIESYHPVRYLFEGQNGNRYSVESVYNVFRNALKKAGIMKDVGVHSLRHSFATHLHENGLDIRFIQELLGHKSTRTTEIYTHVSRRNLAAIKSPIEDLDLK